MCNRKKKDKRREDRIETNFFWIRAHIFKSKEEEECHLLVCFFFFFFFYTDGGGFFDSEIDEKAPRPKTSPPTSYFEKENKFQSFQMMMMMCYCSTNIFIFCFFSPNKIQNVLHLLFCFPSKFNTTRNLKPTDVSFFPKVAVPSTMGWGWGVAGDLKREINK